MSDRYTSFANSGPGRLIVRRLGLPSPPVLRRYTPGEPLAAGPVEAGGTGRMLPMVRRVLAAGGDGGPGASGSAPAGTGPEAGVSTGDGAAALLFDATDIADTAGLRALYDFFHPRVRGLLPSGRVVVFGTPPADCPVPGTATAQRALSGFVRSLGKEVGHGGTANLVQVAPGAEDAAESTVRFLLSGRSAYLSGQAVRVGTGTRPSSTWDRERPLYEKVALVTGAARGIGAAIAGVLARDGAHVVCLDLPSAGDALAEVANRIEGTAYQLDLTTPEAPERLAEHLEARHGGVDIVVHNAGITRDRTLARMRGELWDQVLDVNLGSQERVNSALLGQNLVPSGGRLIGVSSVAGIAGNRGQTNYATSKAGVIGLVDAMAPALAPHGITVNAVAPGFIETAMTARMPMMLREAGRRMNSLSQGGLPVDVAEAVAWLAAPGSYGVTGNVVRVCGQSLLGA
jgi:3-oxoacyl-[acyl-carrier protein] reductase